MVLEHGYVGGVHGILLSEDGGTHQNDLGAGNTRLKGHFKGSHTLGYTLKVSLLVVFRTTQPVKTVVQCLLGLQT